MKAHALFPPSSAFRWLKCPGSAWLNQTQRIGHAAALGMDIHRIAKEHADRFGPTDVIDEEFVRNLNPINFDRTIEVLTPWFGRLSLFSPVKTFWEARLPLNFIAPDTFGTADAIVVEENAVWVMDLKTGVKFVDAYENEQLGLYALGMEDSGLLSEKELELPVRLLVFQVRDGGGVSETVFDFDRGFRENLLERIRIFQTRLLGNDSLYSNGDHCVYCQGVAGCPIFVKKYAELVKMMESEPVRSFSDTELSELRRTKFFFDSAIKPLLEEYDEDLKTGRLKSPDWTVVKRSGRTYWNDDALDRVKEEFPQVRDRLVSEKLIPLSYAKKFLLAEELESLTHPAPDHMIIKPARSGKWNYSRDVDVELSDRVDELFSYVDEK